MTKAEKKRFKRDTGFSPIAFYAIWGTVYTVIIGALVSPFVMWVITEFNKI